MPARRTLPAELAAALERARATEAAADTQQRRSFAVAATARLLVAAVDAGWTMTEIAPVAGLKRSTAQRRAAVARARGADGRGLNVPLAPTRTATRPEVLAAPRGEREWLTAPEAAELAGVDRSTIARWRRAGVLPNTWWITTTRPLYLRADILRLARAPRWRNGGVKLADLALNAE